MKYVITVITALTVVNSFADVILSDSFSNGDLATYTNGVSGGFYIIGSGSGEATEVDDVVRVTNSSNKNDTYGILSSNTVSLTSVPGATSLVTRWEVTDSDLKDKTSLMAFTWQTSDMLTDTPDIAVVLDLNNTNASLFVGGDTNSLADIELEANFGAPGDAFSLTATFTSSGFVVVGEGELTAKSGSPGDILFAGSWGVSPKSFEGYHVGATVKAKGTNGLIVDLESVTVDAIPEPAVIGLIGLGGGSMLFYRRITKRNKSDSEA